MKLSIEYLGHVIDSKVIHPTEEKVHAIREAPTPKNTSELKSFLGMITYYARFLSNLSSGLMPLYSLLSKQTKWCLSEQQETAFQTAKEALQDSLLIHYNDSKPLLLACDTSQYGLGQSHPMFWRIDRND